MKLLFDTAWFTALTRWRAERRVDPDAGDMGTAFGLDSITVVDFEAERRTERVRQFGDDRLAAPRDATLRSLISTTS